VPARCPVASTRAKWVARAILDRHVNLEHDGTVILVFRDPGHLGSGFVVVEDWAGYHALNDPDCAACGAVEAIPLREDAGGDDGLSVATWIALRHRIRLVDETIVDR